MAKQISKSVERLFAILLSVILLFSVMPISANAVETNSDGYIEVKTVQDLYNIRLDLTANYILMNDIDLTAATAEGGDWDFMGNGWNPIGSNDIYGNGAFSGEFDGNGHSIIGMQIRSKSMPSGVSSTKYIGLFANITGSVHDLMLKSTDITWSKSLGCIGTVAGNNSGSIYNVIADINISIKEKGYVGGIVGCLQGTVSRCSTKGSINYTFNSNSDTGMGGIVGYASAGTIEECYNIRLH